MEMWKQELERGKQFLFSQQTDKAIGELNRAMEHCPVEHTIGLSEILFFMGTAFLSLGQQEYAYRCWENAAMLRDADAQEDYDLNWRAFYRIQLIKYLSKKKQKQFGTLAESDFVTDLIKTAWQEVRQQPRLYQTDFHGRCSLFWAVDIMFPYEPDQKEPIGRKKVGHIVSFSTKKPEGGKK